MLGEGYLSRARASEDFSADPPPPLPAALAFIEMSNVSFQH
jgi:hypothetical protein